jgi:hypothetical protein
MLLNDMHTDWNASDNDTREGIVTLHTSGEGYWSGTAKAVRVTELRLQWVDEDESFGELCVHFNTDDWRVDKLGLIYTDRQFEAELCEYLTSIGLDGSDCGYSEQGMQGDNYVSCDVGESFIASYKAKFADKFRSVYADCNS